MARRKKILCVEFDFPGGFGEYVPLTESRSLSDADIVVVHPSITHYSAETYLGKPSLSEHSSFENREAVNHWRKEIFEAMQAGKTIFVFLHSMQEVWVDTGQKQHSGTGRNRQMTRLVEPLSNYSMLPGRLSFVKASGTSMQLAQNADVLSSYWKEFSESSSYEVYIEGDVTKRLVVSRDGNRLLGAMLRLEDSPGHMVLLPDLDYDQNEMVEEKDDEFHWNAQGMEFGQRLSSQLVELNAALKSQDSVTPRPTWADSPEFSLKKERTLQETLLRIETKLQELNVKKRETVQEIRKESSLKRLLYEKGKPLEVAILDALDILGFAASPYRDSESEFDAVFESKEGRFIGEAEGKDNKAINIDKLRQLDMNIHEDLSREEVDEPAKGVLFGNGFRLTPPHERDDFFTQKCMSAAKRSGVALVRTPDLFDAVRYLKPKTDKRFATACRKAIFAASGTVASFPDIPEEKEKKAKHTTRESSLSTEGAPSVES